MLKTIGGGVCAAKGFTAAGVHAGVKAGSAPEKNDLMLLYSEAPCNAWGMYTKNVVKAASVLLTREHLRNGAARAVVANSGNANACCDGSMENARRMARCAAAALGVAEEEVAVGSTGVIGQTINISAIENAIPAAAKALSREGSGAAAAAIMTTDTVKKEEAVSVEIGGRTVCIGGISKGSGMIHPNMGTMLCFLTTDCAISKGLVKKALEQAVRVSFNASAWTATPPQTTPVSCWPTAWRATRRSAKRGGVRLFRPGADGGLRPAGPAHGQDGEGAKHLITCTVAGAKDEAAAERLAKSVIGSSLTKAAVFGCDANWAASSAPWVIPARNLTPSAWT